MSTKRKLTQEELRKAMHEQQRKLSGGVTKRIESPLARYTESGQLTCILCKSVVRSDLAWPVHLNSKLHRENIALAKRTKLQLESESSRKTSLSSSSSSPPSGVAKTLAASRKRPGNADAAAAAAAIGDSKRPRGILKNSRSTALETRNPALPSDFFDDHRQLNPATRASGTTTGSGIEGDEKIRSLNKGDKEVMEVEGDAPATAAAGGKETDGSGTGSGATILPEGFFDDPILDAKVRNVEYKDPVEEEWERFQKEIKEETAQSAQIIADDQEEATTERQRDEIEEQIRHWSRVMDLVKRKEEVQATERKRDHSNEDASSEDEAEFDEFLDWRAKNSYR